MGQQFLQLLIGQFKDKLLLHALDVTNILGLVEYAQEQYVLDD